MKKKIAILTAAMLMAMTAKAQMFTMEDEVNELREPVAEDHGIIPFHGVEFDQSNYIPLGDGALLLAALGGAYLLNRKNKCEKRNISL